MSDAQTPPDSWRDRSGGLRVGGGILIVLGTLCAGLAVVLLLTSAVQLEQRWVSAAAYAVIAAVLIVLGVGSWLARRWARDLILAGSVATLATGVLTGPFLVWIIVEMATAAPQVAEVQGLGCIIAAVLGGMLAVFGLLPLAFLIFYARRDVRQTVERLHPEPGWTQAQRLPVFTTALLYAVSAVAFLFNVAEPALPVPGGGLLTGAPAGVAYLLMAAVSGVIAWGLYRGKRSVWIAAVILTTVWLTATLLAFRDLDFQKLQEAMGTSEDERAILAGIDLAAPLSWMLAVNGLAWLGYLVWLKKYFEPRRAQLQ